VVKLVDLNHQLQSIRSELNQTITQTLQAGHFSEGQLVYAFESQFSQTHQSSHCIALNSGTSALHAILMSLNIGTGDQVLLPTNTCFPIAEAVCMTGATPVLVDCEEKYYSIDPDQIEQAITPRTKAIIAVHLYGQAAQVDAIKKITDLHDLHLIEDCAQAHMASFDDIMVGNFGVAGAFSFYPTKNLGAFGEGGAVLTNQPDLADRVRALKNHGSYQKNVHEFIGHNYRMDSIQAAILSVKLKYLKRWTNKRRENAQYYMECLSDCEQVKLPKEQPKAYHVFHQFVIRAQQRDKLQSFLLKNGVETAVHYPIPCHLQPAFKHLGYTEGSFPISEQLAKEILSLPVAEHINKADVDHICQCIKNFYLG
jgi:dTDP-4-amino-4,6-dideoxygalactose transaminase